MQPGPVIVAGFADVSKMAGRPLIYVEHGAGQTYPGDVRSATNGSYSGGLGLGDVVLFLGPSETVAARWRERYPATPAVAVGCPRLDPWHDGSRSSPSSVASLASTSHSGDSGQGRPARTDRSTIALAFHWDCPLIPETRSAWSHYEHGIRGPVAAWRAAGLRVLGHGHPRAWRQLRPQWIAAGVEPVESFAEVLDRADLLVVDNSSVGPEFASTGRPVVWLNAPWYRRDVEHGGRFWDWPAGQVQVDDVDGLAGGVEIGLSDPRIVADSRARMVAEVYAHVDGHAAERAANAIREVIGE